MFAMNVQKVLDKELETMIQAMNTY